MEWRILPLSQMNHTEQDLERERQAADPTYIQLATALPLAAAREAWEEAGIDPAVLEFKAIFSDDHGNWRYDTVIAHSPHDAGAHEANAESEDIRWVPLDDVHRFELHPGLKRAWPELIDHVRSTLSADA